MQEYIVSCEGMWWHFFNKLGYGLCFRKKDGAHFSDFEILLKDIQEDFCVIPLGNSIHAVCQDNSGSILYLKYSGGKWEKVTLLASKIGSPYPKYFRLVTVGSFINLYYVINHKEKHMLVHQILNGSSYEPTVVDYINMCAQPFSVCAHSSTDLSVCYANSQGICGIRTFRWSQKNYSPFVRLPCDTPVFSPFIKIKDDDTAFFVALGKLDLFCNLIFMRREPDGTFSEMSTVYLDCDKNTRPILFSDGSRLFIQWIENGNVMMSYSDDDGQKWKKPTKYMRGSSTTVTVYNIYNGNKYFCCCGFSDNGTIHLYCDNNPLVAPPDKPLKNTFKPRGFEAAEFARSFGYRKQQETMPEPEYALKEELYREIAEIRETLARHDSAICSILKPNSSPDVPIAENEDDIDKIVMKNTNDNKADIKIPSSTAKIVVTGK